MDIQARLGLPTAVGIQYIIYISKKERRARGPAPGGFLTHHTHMSAHTLHMTIRTLITLTLLLLLSYVMRVDVVDAQVGQNGGFLYAPGHFHGLGLNPLAFGAKGDNATDDRAALAATDVAAVAASPSNSILISAVHRISSNITITSSIAFAQGGQLVPDTGVTITLNGTSITAPDTQQVFAGVGTVSAPNVSYASVGWWGAYAAAQAGTDAGPGFRGALGSNRKIVIPASALPYKFSTSPTVASWPVSAGGVTFNNLSNFEVVGNNAVVEMNWAATTCGTSRPAGPECWRAQTFEFSGDTNFSVHDVIMQGQGYATNEVASMTVHNSIDFTFDHIRVLGYGGAGSAVNAAWDSRGTFSNWYAPQVHFFTDSAFLNMVTFDKIKTLGIGSDNATGVGGPAFSFIYDPVNVGHNTSGITFTDTQHVTITNSDCSNFNVCVYMTAGSDYILKGNHWHDNPGAASVSGNGAQIAVDANTNVTPNTISIDDLIENNGTGVSGFGVYLSTAQGGGTGNIHDIKIGGLIYNNTAVGVSSDSSSRKTNIFINARFGGTNQTTNIGASIDGISTQITGDTLQLQDPSNNTMQVRVSGKAATPAYLNNDFYLGNGVNNAAPSPNVLRTTDGLGTDISGGDMTFIPGRGTGAGCGGTLRLKMTPAGSTGSTLNIASLFPLTIDCNGNAGIGLSSLVAAATNGFFAPPDCSPQTGTPTAQSGHVPACWDSTNHVLVGYENGAWHTGVRPATTGSIGGSPLTVGTCTSGTVAVTSSTTAMAVLATPVTYPGDGIWWEGYVSTNGTVTVKVCASASITPTATTYNVRVIQ